jgi:hypothetical protein
MTNPKSGTGLSETAKSYCQDWLKSQLYPTKKDIRSKYLSKGNDVENDAIIYASQVLQLGFVEKNTQRLSNEYCEGECDIITHESIDDIKCSWDCYTFPLFEVELPEKDYFWQLEGYMWLYGKTKASVIYCLMSMPERQLNKEAFYRYGNEITKEQYEALKAQYTYDGLDDKLRIRQFKIDYDPEKIEQIKARVLLCREYIHTLITQI